MKKRIITLVFAIVLLVPCLVKAEKYVEIEGLLFNGYDIMLDSDIKEYYITVENSVDKLSISNENKCSEDELCLDVHLLEYFLFFSDSFIFNDERVSSIEKIAYANNYDDVIFDEEVESTKTCDYYKIDNKTRMISCKIYDNEDNLLYEESTIYNENEEIIGYTKYKDNEYIDSHYYIGNLNVGENILSLVNQYKKETYIIHITRKEKEEVVQKEEIKEDNNTIKEDDNIKESPNTGSTINIVIGLFLLISFSVLLYLDKKHKQVK